MNGLKMTRSSCCPMCYKIGPLSQENSDDLKKREAAQNRFFKFFQRYLTEGNGEITEDIKVDKKMRQFQGHEYFHQPEKLSAFGMLACVDCHSQMEAFCDLYDKLKATELLLNWKVWTVKNIMTGAQRVTSRVKSFREFIQQMEVIEPEVEGIMGSGDGIINSIVKSRKSLIVKCSRKIENATPKLSIVRWEPGGQKICSNEDIPSQKIRPAHKITSGSIEDEEIRGNWQLHKTNSNSVITANPALEDADTTSNGNNAEESPNTICISSPAPSGVYKGDHNGNETNSEDSSPIDMDCDRHYIDEENESDNHEGLESETASATNKTATNKIVEASKKASYLNNFDDTMKMEADPEYVDEIAPESSTPEVQLCHVQNSNTGSEEGIRPLENSLEHISSLHGSNVSPNEPRRSPPVVKPGTSKQETAIEATSTTTCDESQYSETRSRLRSTHKCHKCGRTFSSGDRLLSHEQEVHGEDDFSDIESILSEYEPGHIDNDMRDVSPSPSSSSSSSTSDEYDDDMDFLSGTEEKIPESKIGVISIQLKTRTSPSSQTILAVDNDSQNSSIKRKRPMHKELAQHHAFRLRCPDCQSLFEDVKGILTHRKFASTCNAAYDPKLSVTVDVLVPPSNRESNSKDDDDSKFSVVFAKIALPQEIFLCEKCDLAVYSSEDMAAHNKLHGSFRCQFCGANEEYAPNLSRHELEHAVTEGKQIKTNGNHSIFCCARCDYGVGDYKRYILHHLKTHLGLVVKKPKCAICKTNGRYVTIRGLATHFATHHDLTGISGSKGLHTCPKQNCAAYFLLTSQLKNHMEIRHNRNTNLRSIHAKTTTRRRRRRRATLTRNKPGSNAGTKILDESKSHYPQQNPDCSERVEDKILEDNPSSALDVIKMAVPTTCPKIKDNTIIGLYFRLKCPDCNLLFKDVKSLLTHRRNSQSCTGTYDPNASIKVEVVVPPPEIKQKETKVSSRIADKHFSSTFAIIDLPQRMFECEDCGLVLYSSESLERHKSLHGKFNCNVCQMELTYAKNLAIHELQHSGKVVKPSKRVNCPGCDVFSTDRIDNQFVAHYLSQHMSLKWYGEPLCAICETTPPTLSKWDIGGHFKLSHDLTQITDPRDIVRCQIGGCDAYFLKRAQLALHLKFHHNIEKDQRMTDGTIRVNCKDCDKSYAEPGPLHRHRLKYHVPLEKVIPCPFKKCNKVYETRQQLELHLACFKERHKALDKPKEKEFVNCPVCDKRISAGRSSFLKAHMKSHGTSNVCEQCGKQFTDRLRLETHKLTHSGPESWQYSCGVCGKKCLDKGKLKQHMRTHTKETPYVCEICGQKYAHRHNLRIHVNNKHGDEVQDIPRKINTKNFTSKKGIKRKKVEENDSSDDGDDQ